MAKTKIVQTDITEDEIVQAQGGDGGSSEWLARVEMPDSYDPRRVSAHDVIHDGSMRVIDYTHRDALGEMRK